VKQSDDENSILYFFLTHGVLPRHHYTQHLCANIHGEQEKQ